MARSNPRPYEASYALTAAAVERAQNAGSQTNTTGEGQATDKVVSDTGSVAKIPQAGPSKPRGRPPRTKGKFTAYLRRLL